MYKLTIAGQQYACRPQETVLDALLREKVDIPHGCRQGVCQSCIVRSPDVAPPAQAQKGLKDTQKKQNHFLACLCHPEQDMVVAMPNQSCFYTEGTVIDKQMLNANMVLLIVKCKDVFEYYAGQFVNLQRTDGLTRSYSIANTPQLSDNLEFHIRVLPGGRFSGWVHNELAIGDSIAVSEPQGHCFYVDNRSEQGLLMVGTGSGLAPLAGILQDALQQGHHGPIHLFHGVRKAEELYKVAEMRQLTRQYKNFFYTPCISGSHVPTGFCRGRASDVALATLKDLKDWRVFLCGHPEMIKQMRLNAFLQGASPQDIYTDAFHLSDTY